MLSHEHTMSDGDLEVLVAELAADGIVVTREEAQRAVYRLAELLLLISAPLPLPSPSEQQAIPEEEDQFLGRDEQFPSLG